MNQNLSNFFLCGSAGWCLEILWTGLHSLLAGQRTMTRQNFSFDVSHLRLCRSYRTAVCQNLHRFLFFTGDFFILFGFYLVEFLSGSVLKQFGMCPWDYSGARFSVSWNHPS